MFKKWMALFIVITSLLLFLGVTLYPILSEETSPKALQGVLDLQRLDWAKERKAHLDGEWEYYPNEFFSSQQDITDQNTSPIYVIVPGGLKNKNDIDTYGYGTYRLRVLVHPIEKDTFAFRMKWILSAHTLFVNGEKISSKGIVSAHPERYVPEHKAYTNYAEVEESQPELDIFLQVANYDHAFGGKISNSIIIGSPFDVTKITLFNLIIEGSITIIFVIFTLMFFSLLLFLKKINVEWIYFLLYSMSTMIYFSLQGERWAHYLVPHISFSLLNKTILVSSVGVIGFLYLFIYRRHSRHEFKIAHQFLTVILIGTALFFALSNIRFSSNFIILWAVMSTIISVYILYLSLRSTKNGDDNSKLEFALLVSFVMAEIINIELVIGMQERNYLMGFQLIMMVMAFTYVLAQLIIQRYRQVKTLMKQLIQLDKRKDEFLRVTSHELKTPLHAITNIAQLLVERADDPAPQKNVADLRLISSITKKMDRLINDLLDWSRIREGQLSIYPQAVNVFQVVESTIDVLRNVSLDQNIKIVNSIPSVPLVLADEERLLQIMSNLIHNAVKNTCEGKIEITAKQLNEDLLQISVSDTGKGIPEDKLERIFQAYEQVGTEAESLGGTGLGLTISKMLVELHGGTIRVESKRGTGSTSFFTMPIAKEDQICSEVAATKSQITWSPLQQQDLLEINEEKVEQIPLSEMQEWGEAHILIVDDDPLNIKVMSKLLSFENVQISSVSTGEEALRLVDHSSKWDLIILDIMLPGISGLKVCSTIRKKHLLFEMPVLILTASGRTDDILASFAVGANDFLSKPVQAAELRSRVRTLLEMKRSVNERLRMEMAFLQAQIKPHFIFNTLNSIAALSEEHPEQMKALIDEFSHYLHESYLFGNLDLLVPIQRELKIVRSYLYIEKVRFGERLNITHDDPGNLSCQIPPLTIQPLVENAIRHGVLKRIEGGRIQIQIVDQGDEVTIQVRDNGVGISPEKLKSIMTKDSVGGIGLKNIELRMKRLFGTGLSIRSEVGKGTTVEMRILKNGVPPSEQKS